MDRVEEYRQIIKQVFHEYALLPYAHGDLKKEIIADNETDKYLLIVSGWEGAKRIHGCITHIDIINGKLWIQHDNIEYGIAEDLERHGVPKEHIVLGFYAPELRQHTEYAVE